MVQILAIFLGQFGYQIRNILHLLHESNVEKYGLKLKEDSLKTTEL